MYAEKEKFKEVLQKNGIKIKSTGQNEYILCPFHADKNPSLIINNYNTYCFACKSTYSFRDVLERLGIKEYIAEPDNPEVLKHIKLNKILEEYAEKSHSRLVQLLNSKKYSYIKSYLLKERGIRKEVLEGEDIGVLIADSQICEYLTDYKEEYPETTDTIDKLISLISKSDDDTLLFFYRNENFNITSIRFRNPRLQKRFQFKHWKKGKSTGIWGIKRINTKEKLLGVEGEFNLLALKSVLPASSVIAVGSSNADYQTIKALVERFDLNFYYCFDNDEPGFKTVWHLKNYIPVYAFTTKGYNDLDEARKQIADDNRFTSYLQKILQDIRLFKANTKQWNNDFYNADNFVIEDDTLYLLKDESKIKVSTTPFIITGIINKYGIEYLNIKTKTKDLLVPKETLLNIKKVISLTQKGFNFTSSDSKYISKFVKELLDENVYPVEVVDIQPLSLNGILKGDVVLSKTGYSIKEIISFKEDGIWHIKYSDDFEYKKLSGFVITGLDVFEHLLTNKKIYEFAYSNKFENYKDSFKSIDDFSKKIIIDKKQYPKLSLALSIALNKLKTDNIEKRLPDIKAGFYLSGDNVLYVGEWKDTQEFEYLTKAVENLKVFINLFPDKRKSLAVLYSTINSAFAFIRKQLGYESMIPILAGKGLTGKTTIVEHLLKMFELYREKSGQSINSYRRLAETVVENAIPVLINECENVLKNQSIVDVLKNIGGQDLIAHADAKKEITFIAYSGLILTTNRIPNNLDTALISRFVPILYTAEDIIIDKKRYETDVSYRKYLQGRKQQLKQLSEDFHLIGKALIYYATNYSERLISILKNQHREANSYIETGRQILINMLSLHGIDTSFFVESYADTLEEITSDEEENTETAFISDIARKIREANRTLDTRTKELLQVNISVEERIRELYTKENKKELKEFLSIIMPDYLIITSRSSKVILRKSVMDKLKINLSGGFTALCSQLGFRYTSRKGERVGIMDFDTFLEIIAQVLMCEDDYDEELDKLLSFLSFPVVYDNNKFESKAEFIRFYKSLSEEGKTTVYESLMLS